MTKPPGPEHPDVEQVEPDHTERSPFELLLAEELRTGLSRRKPWLFRPFEHPRAGLEMLAFSVLWPLLRGTTAPDDHPVLVVPGLGGGNIWTLPLRSHLAALGYNVHGIKANSQHGTPRMVIDALVRRIDRLADPDGQQVSVVAWSVGGAYARQACLIRKTRIRQLITLGAPLNGPWYIWQTRHAAELLPFPTTSILSHSDGVYNWHRCAQPDGPEAENAEVFSSHFGMANNPLAIRVVLDRLAQPHGVWYPYGQAPEDARRPRLRLVRSPARTA